MKKTIKSLLMSVVIVNGAFASEGSDEKQHQIAHREASQQQEGISWAAIVSNAEAQSIQRAAQQALEVQEVDQESPGEYVNDQLKYIQNKFADYIKAQCKKHGVEAWHKSIANDVNPMIQNSLARKHKLSGKQARRIDRMIKACINEAGREKTAQIKKHLELDVEEAMDSRKDARGAFRRAGTVQTKLAQHVLSVRSVAQSNHANGSRDFAKQLATEKVKLIKHLARQHKNTLKTSRYARASELVSNPSLPEVTDIDQI